MSSETPVAAPVVEKTAPVVDVEKAVPDKFAPPTVQEHNWVSSPRSFMYASAWFVTGAIAVALLGLVAQQITNGGRNLSTTHYPNAEIYHTLGLLLFNTIFTLLVALGSYKLPLQFAAALLFMVSVIYITAAGIVYGVTPYRSGNCGGTFAAPFDYFASQCQHYVAIQALSWVMWVISMAFCAGIIAESILVKHKKGAFYSY